MCLAVYLASTHPLPEVAWNKDAPAFYLSEAANNESARKRFSYQFVYYAGSHEGCGCGFSKDGEEGEDRERCQANYAALGRTIRQAMRQGANLQVFTCWEGEQSCEPESVGSISPSELEAPEYELQQLELLSVRNADA